MMRVIAGSARRLQLKTPRGERVRPTTDQIKETLFNMIQGQVEGTRFLDLFAGSGGIGIEALSRGASFCAFGEQDREALACIRDNLAHTHLAERALVCPGDFMRTLSRLRKEAPFDIIFIDPPYRQELEEQVLKAICSYGLIDEQSLIIVETLRDRQMAAVVPAGLQIVREKEYKSNKHVFIRQGE